MNILEKRVALLENIVNEENDQTEREIKFKTDSNGIKYVEGTTFINIVKTKKEMVEYILGGLDEYSVSNENMGAMFWIEYAATGKVNVEFLEDHLDELKSFKRLVMSSACTAIHTDDGGGYSVFCSKKASSKTKNGLNETIEEDVNIYEDFILEGQYDE